VATPQVSVATFNLFSADFDAQVRPIQVGSSVQLVAYSDTNYNRPVTVWMATQHMYLRAHVTSSQVTIQSVSLLELKIDAPGVIPPIVLCYGNEFGSSSYGPDGIAAHTTCEGTTDSSGLVYADFDILAAHFGLAGDESSNAATITMTLFVHYTNLDTSARRTAVQRITFKPVNGVKTLAIDASQAGQTAGQLAVTVQAPQRLASSTTSSSSDTLSGGEIAGIAIGAAVCAIVGFGVILWAAGLISLHPVKAAAGTHA
jgi:hypothetical protein